MQTDNQPPITLPGGGSLTLPAMSGGNTQSTPQTTAAHTTSPSGFSDFSTPSGEWSIAAGLALFIVVIILVIVKVFFAGSWADHASDGAEEALSGRWTPFIALLAFIAIFTIGLALTGTKLW